MEFRDYAAKETSAIFGRLVTSHAEQQLRHVREALDAAARAVDTAAASEPRADDDLKDLVQKLNAAAGAAAQKIQQESRKELDAANARTEELRTQLAKETERADTAEADLDATIEAHKQVDGERMRAEAGLAQEAKARAAAEDELRGVRELLETTRAEATRLSGELESEAAQRAILDADLIAARAERDAISHELADVSARAEALMSELSRTGAERDAVSAQLAAAGAASETLSAQLAAAAAESGTLSAQLASARADRDAVAAGRDAVVAERDAIAAGRDAATAERDTAIAQRDGAAADRDAVRSERDSIALERDAIAGDRAQISALLAEVTAQLEVTRAAASHAEGEQRASQDAIHRLEARLADALAMEATLREQAAGADAQMVGAQAQIATLGSSTDRMGALLDASVRALDEMGAATTVTDLLAALVKQLAAEFPRVALFRVKGNHLEGEHGIGLDATADVTKLVIPLNVDSIITKAVVSGTVEQIDGSELADNRMPFGGTPAVAIALPIPFQQETLAVIYVDSEQPAHAAQGAFARLLVRHTVVLLTRLSQELKTLMELREYAVMLLQEAEQMYAADVEAGKPEKERRSRLKETIECARQLYAQRAALEGTAAAALLDEQVSMIVSAEPATPFAKDLADATGQASGHSRSRRTAS